MNAIGPDGEIRCNMPAGSLVARHAETLGYADVEKSWSSSPFDGRPTWNCAEPVGFVVTYTDVGRDNARVDHAVCRVHAAAWYSLSEAEDVSPVTIGEIVEVVSNVEAWRQRCSLN